MKLDSVFSSVEERKTSRDKMLFVVVLAVVASCALCAPTERDLDEEWNTFKQKHNKTYKPDEEPSRREVWLENRELIQRHNEQADRGLHSYRLGMNHLGDLTNREINDKLNGLRMPAKRTEGATYPPPQIETLSVLPDSVDWRSLGYVTLVKNQGNCGACYAFACTGALEGQRFKKTGKLVRLSEQQIVDCSKQQGNQGCRGGLMTSSYHWVMDNGGIVSEESYPYTGMDGHCRRIAAASAANCTGYVELPRGSESSLQAAVAEVGPISVAIDASWSSFHFYAAGTYYESACSSTALNHGVLVVGYGTDSNGRDFWIVKNSWGPSWGAQGYIQMSRNVNNNCGIASMCSYPLM